jgi:hypothetical protein
VSHVPEKLANSLDRLKQERDAGRAVLIALPAGNASEVPPELASELSALGIETIALPHVQPLFDALAMALPGGPGRTAANTPPPVPAAEATPPPAPTPPRRRWVVRAVAASALLAVAATAGVLLNHKDETTAPTTRQPQLADVPPPPAPTQLIPEQATST